jgi:membrane protease YdiL (CAAX protease family)
MNSDRGILLSQWDKIKKNEGEKTPDEGYFKDVRKMVYSLAVVIPLAIIYELASFIVNQDFFAGVRSSAEVWILNLLRFMGLPLYLPLSIIFILLWLLIYIYQKRKGIDFKIKYLLWMLLEAMILAVVFGLTAGLLTGFILPGMLSPAQMISVSFGAGLYEELIFRVLLIPAIFWVLNKLNLNRILSWIISIAISSLIFAFIHHIGQYGEPFTIQAFTFRFISGCIFAILYVARGFGITAWTHSMYDIYVITGVFELF